MSDADTVRARVRELAPWYQNIDLGNGLTTKDLDDPLQIFPGADIPAPLWRLILRDLDDLVGRRVLDIGCNAGYMSFECKKLGAESVLGIDTDLGSITSFVDQALFCRNVLGLDVEFRRQSLFELTSETPFDLVLFCGVLYHLENWADALDKLRELVVPGTGRVVVETAIEPVTQTIYGDKSYRGDPATFFVPSLRVLLALLDERGFAPIVVRDLGTRALAFVSLPHAA